MCGSIEAVVFNTHATPSHLRSDNPYFKIDSSYVSKLGKKNIKSMILLGCNAGHLDHSNNIASCFAKKFGNITSIMASDGTVSSRSFWGSYNSKNDETFQQYRPSNSRRNNSGWIIYKSNIIYKGFGKSLRMKQMLSYLKQYA
jgi:hypothetical protein